MIICSSHELETENIAREMAKNLKPGDTVALFGDLGAGKTAFVRGLAKGLSITDRVTSPTYAIVNEYKGPVPLFHFDMYRLSGEDELFDIGLDDYLSRGGIIAVEWSENIEKALPKDCIKVIIRKIDGDENARELEIINGP